MNDPSDILTQAAPLEGFELETSSGTFSTNNGPSFRRETDETLEMGFRVLDKHCNGLGFLHGGMLSAFSDSAMARGLFKYERKPCVTIRLTVDFIRVGQLGDWISVAPRHLSTNGLVVHMQGEILRNETQIVAQAAGVFQIIRRKMK